MKLGFDIDGVMNDFQSKFIEFAKEFTGKDPKIDLSKYNVLENFDMTPAEQNEFWRKYGTKAFAQAKPQPGVAKVMQELFKDGHQIYAITSRSTQYKGNLNATVFWLVYHGVAPEVAVAPTPQQKFNGMGLLMDCADKAKVCLQYGIDLMVDDDPKHCKRCHQAGIKTLVFNQPYNRHVIGLTRVYSWTQIYAEIALLNERRIH